MSTPIYGKYGLVNDEEEARRIAKQKSEQEQRTAAPVVNNTPVQQPTQTATPTVSTDTTDEQPASRGYTELIAAIQNEIDRRKPEDKKAREAREKRERTQAIISGISDIGSALGNLYNANRGAKSTFDPTEGMSPRYKELWEKSKAERDRTAAERMNYIRMKNNIEQAEENRKNTEKYHNAIIAQREATEKASAEKTAKEEARRKINDLAKSKGTSWKADFSGYTTIEDVDKIYNSIKQELDNAYIGKTDSDEYNALIDKLNEVRSERKTEINKNNQANANYKIRHPSKPAKTTPKTERPAPPARQNVQTKRKTKTQL